MTSALHRYAVEFELDNGRGWGRLTRSVLIEDGYSTLDDVPEILAITYGVNIADVNIISTRAIGWRERL